MALLSLKKNYLAWLIDPDKLTISEISEKIKTIESAGFNLILVGSSILFNDLDNLIINLKKLTTLPIYIFPGSIYQISPFADGILFTSLLSGRNPEFLIGQQVLAAPILKRTNLDVVSVGYILIENGRTTSVEYISNTKPIPADKLDIILATCLAAEYLGFKMVYLEAGSGAINPVPLKIVEKVCNQINIPVIVGGGIKTTNQAKTYFSAGAKIVVIGNAIEDNSIITK
jgi:putative glycerol-1-phosphate prenyltransferase